MYKEKIVDIQSGEETFRELSKNEVADILAAQKEAEEFVAAVEATKAAKLAIFEKLGLTSDEAKLFLS